MQLNIVTTEAGFDVLAADWDRLAGSSPFARWDWHRTWWRAYGCGAKLVLHVVRDQQNVVAIAPWHIGTRRWTGATLQFLANGKACTDYQRVLVDPALSPDERQA